MTAVLLWWIAGLVGSVGIWALYRLDASRRIGNAAWDCPAVKIVLLWAVTAFGGPVVLIAAILAWLLEGVTALMRGASWAWLERPVCDLWKRRKEPDDA